MLFEALTLAVGPAIAKSILKLWLQDSEIGSSALTSVVDLLSKKTSDVRARQRGNREFEMIGERVAESLLPLFDEFPIDEEEKTAVAHAIADTLNTTQLQPDILARYDLEPAQLSNYLLQKFDEVTRDFSESGAALYRRNIQEIAAYVVDIASQLPAFTEQTFAEVLKRERQLLNITEQILEEVRKIRAESIESNSEAAAARFEEEYRRTVIRKLDELELFGVDVSHASRRHRLSVAYVTLSVEPKNSIRAKKTVLVSNISIDQSIHSKSRWGDSSLPYASSTDKRSYIPLATSNKNPKIDISNTLSAPEALAKTYRLIINGQAGSGKTTLLKWVAVQSALQKFSGELEEWNDTIPFFIRLRQLNDQQLPSPEGFPILIAPMITDIMPKGWVHQQLNNGRAIVLIDGLDEVSESMRKDVHDWIKDLTKTFNKSHFVLSTRPHAINQNGMDYENFRSVELQPMTSTDIDNFIDHWHQAVGEQLQNQAKVDELSKMTISLKSTLRQTRTLAKLATNPLLCAMLCAIHRDQNQKLPKDRIELYETCCHMLLVRRDEERAISQVDYPQMSYREKKMLLKHLAYWMIDNGYTMIDVERVDTRIAHKLPDSTRLQKSDPKLIRNFFIQRSSLLREPHPGKIDFTHRTFQEYLAAEAATDEDNIGVLIEHAQDTEWQEVITLAAGLASKAQRKELVQSLMNRGDMEESHRHTFHLLSVSCLEITPELDPMTQIEVQKRLFVLIPPKNMTEATTLAMAGELPIPYLHYDARICVEEIISCIKTLSLIGGEAAEIILSQYACDDRKIVLDELKRIIDNDDIYLAWLVSQQPDLTIIDLSGTNVKNINPLANLTKLTSLNLDYTQLDDTTSLTSLSNLTSLSLDCTQVEDINSLTNLINLTFLSLWDIGVENIGPLANLKNLTSLNLSGTRIEDVNSLAKLTNLKSLNLSYTKVIDVRPLAKLTNLTTLNLQATEVVDISPLINLENLTSLNLQNTKIKDIAVLKQFNNLVSLDLSRTKIKDISPLSNLSNLAELTISQIDLQGLTSLNNLTSLNLSYANIEEIGLLARLTNLISLNLSGTKVKDVSPLASLMNLTSLNLHGTQVEDVHSLNHLKNLHIWGKGITN